MVACTVYSQVNPFEWHLRHCGISPVHLTFRSLQFAQALIILFLPNPASVVVADDSEVKLVISAKETMSVLRDSHFGSVTNSITAREV